MRQWALQGIALMFLAGCAGGGNVSSYLDVEREHIQALRDLTEILGTVKDKSTMTSALAEMKKSYQRVEGITKKLKSLPAPTDEIRQQIDEALGPQIRQATSRYIEEGARISRLPGGDDFLKELKTIK